MNALRQWSFARVVMTAAAWFVLSIAAWLYFTVRGMYVLDEGAGGVGALSVTINPLVAAIPILPPVVLLLVWLIVRRRKSA